MESFRGIQEECEEIISAIKTTLLAQIGDSSLSRRKMTSVVSLLLQLKVPATELAQHVLDRARSQVQYPDVECHTDRPVLPLILLLTWPPIGS
jgi:hypothetical protein